LRALGGRERFSFGGFSMVVKVKWKQAGTGRREVGVEGGFRQQGRMCTLVVYASRGFL